MPTKKKTKPKPNSLIEDARKSASQYRKKTGQETWFTKLESHEPNMCEELKTLCLDWHKGGETRDLFPSGSASIRFGQGDQGEPIRFRLLDERAHILMSIKKKIDAWSRNEATESQELLTMRSKLKQLEAQLKRERSAKEMLERTLDRLRGSRVKLRLDRKAKASKGGVTLRVIVPDSHGCFVDQAAASAMLADIKLLKPSSIILLGDHLDCGGRHTGVCAS